MENQLRRSEQGIVANVPAITIAAYCQTEGMRTVMHAAAIDRRMSRASCIIEVGGMAAAVAAYREARTPNVLIVEVAASPSNMMRELAPLAEVCDPSTLVIVIGHFNDVVLYRELIRSGVAEYLAAPLTQLQLIDAIAGLFRDPAGQPAGRIIAFMGAKGGAGSSTIAHNIGWLFANRGRSNTVVTDLDLAFGTSALNFNQESGSGLAEAIEQADRLDTALLERLLTRCGERLSILAGAAGLDRDNQLDAVAVDAVLDVLRQTAPVIIVDMPSVWSSWSRHTIINADDVVITATPDLASMRNARNIMEVLRASRQNDNPPYLILNQTGVPKRPEISAEDFAKAVGVKEMIVIPSDPQVFSMAATTGRILCDLSPKAKASEEILKLFTSLSSGKSRHSAPDTAAAQGSILARLKAAFASSKK